jgi:DivIVA domain-containing protein
VRPEDIESKEFIVGLRGYDQGQVRDFLAEVAAEHRRALHEGALDPAMREQLEEVRAQIAALMRSLVEEASGLRTELGEGTLPAASNAARPAADSQPRSLLRRVFDAVTAK